MIVMKFGGTSTAGCEQIGRLVSIVAGRLEKTPIVVVSAMSKVTDTLYKISAAAEAKDLATTLDLVDGLRSRHIQVAEELLGNNAGLLLPATSKINEICDELETFTSAVCALGELSDRSKAVIVSNGELLSSTLVGYAMENIGIKTQWLDAREMMITNDNYLCAEPDLDAINEKVPAIISDALSDHQAVITQGFIGSDKSGIQTVLGRGGSDYSASLIGAAMDADVIEIWTDVDGVLTADPRRVPGAKPLERLSFEEAAEMAHFGAKVLHPLTIEPAVKKEIPIYVLNSYKPDAKGTVILKNDLIEEGVKSVSFKENIRVINIFSTKMINATGFLEKVFDIFSRNGVSVDLISTSEANISVTIDSAAKNVDKVVKGLSEFAEVEVDDNKAQISLVGKNLVNIEGIMTGMFESLEGTKLYMVSQGASNINVSVVVDKEELDAAIVKIHKSLFEQ